MKMKQGVIGLLGISSMLVATAGHADHELIGAIPSIPETNILFVSVHPDDTPLTFGGMIQNNQGFSGQNKVITIFEPFSQTNYTADVGASIFTNERISYVTALRYNEDANAYNDLFTTWINYTFLGRLYPELSLRYYLESLSEPSFVDDGEDFIDNAPQTGFNLFGPVSVMYYEVVYNDFLRLLNQTNCAAFLPSAVGNSNYQQHPDHFLVREAAIQAANALANNHSISPSNICQIYFGQDQPYTNGNLAGSISFLTNFVARLGAGTTSTTYPMDKYAKWAMLQNYKSQLDPGYETSLLLRNNETLYFWPKTDYATVQPDPTCTQSYCMY